MRSGTSIASKYRRDSAGFGTLPARQTLDNAGIVSIFEVCVSGPRSTYCETSDGLLVMREWDFHCLREYRCDLVRLGRFLARQALDKAGSVSIFEVRVDLAGRTLRLAIQVLSKPEIAFESSNFSVFDDAQLGQTEPIASLLVTWSRIFVVSED